MAVFTVTSNRRPQEYGGADFAPPYPTCCGRAPVVLTWPRKRRGECPDVAVYCSNPDCRNSEAEEKRTGKPTSTFAYGHEDARRKWEGYRVQDAAPA